jgi:hypothetical protein
LLVAAEAVLVAAEAVAVVELVVTVRLLILKLLEADHPLSLLLQYKLEPHIPSPLELAVLAQQVLVTLL